MVEIDKIYNECALKLMARMDNQSVDLIITSPPYNMRTRIRDGKYTKREKSEHFSKKYKYFSDDLPVDEFYTFHCNVMNEMLRISKIICYNIQLVTGSKEAFLKMIGDYNRYIKDIIIWDKGYGQPAMHSNVLNSCYEMILILESDARAGRVISNSYFDRGTFDNIMRISRNMNIIDGHSAVFPEKLVESLILAFSNKGDVVYDPFLGTGTVTVVANTLDRHYIGSGITEEYYQYAVNRMNNCIYLKNNNFF